MMQNENIRGNDNASMIIVKRRSSVNDTKSRINPNSTRRDEQESYVKCIKLSKSFFPSFTILQKLLIIEFRLM